MFWLGRLSSDAVAASGTIGLFLWMSLAFLFFGRMGAEIGVSQSFGQGDKQRALGFARNSILIGAVLGVLLAAVFIIGREPFVGFFGIQEAHVEKDARDYLAIVSLSMPFAFITASITGIFNGVGNSRISMLINGVGFTLNMVFDPILIFSAGLGIRGAAVATIIAHFSAASLALIMLKKYKNRPFEKIKLFKKPDREIIRQIVKWVTPISVENFLFTFLTMFIAALVASYGTGAMAASRVGAQIDSLTWLIAGGYASALTAFTGQNFGAGKWGRIHKGFKISSAMMAGWGLFVGFILIYGGRALFEIFIPDDPDVVDFGVEYLRILAIIQVPACLESVAAGAFRGQGKTIRPSIASVTSNALRVVLAYALNYYTDLGLTSVWVAIASGVGLRGSWMYIWYLIHSRKISKEDEAI
jgi:putative MATE family efflux protein